MSPTLSSMISAYNVMVLLEGRCMLHITHLVRHHEDEVAPDDVEDEEEGEEEVEDILGREHLKYLLSLNACGEYDNGWVVGQPGVDPGEGEHHKGGVTDLLVLGIPGQHVFYRCYRT